MPVDLHPRARKAQKKAYRTTAARETAMAGYAERKRLLAMGRTAAEILEPDHAREFRNPRKPGPDYRHQ